MEEHGAAGIDKPLMREIACCRIIESEEAILYVPHNQADGIGQFLLGKEARLISLKSIFERNHSVGMLKDMPFSCCAERKTQEDNWNIKKGSP